MYAKIEITGVINVVTGMHIGGSNQFSAIGSVDSPVIRDALSDKPMIPGSSLKGKMRTLLAKKYNVVPAKLPDDDVEVLLRLFGSSKKGAIRRSRLLFSDSILSNLDELNKLGIQSATEIKTENTIGRLTAIANPRQIERVIRGSKFPLELIYEADKESDLEEDFQVISDGFKLMTYDYLGGNGSRGYGKVKFENLELKIVSGEIKPEFLEVCSDMLKEV